MRERLRKSKSRGTLPGKEVKLTVRKPSSLVFCFHNGAEKKISSTNYAAADVDFEESRVYFVETDNEEGWKFSGSKNAKEFRLKVLDADVWSAYEGEYNLFKDRTSGDYYIDLVNKEDK